jgi:methionyl-tRNA formyltransferase
MNNSGLIFLGSKQAGLDACRALLLFSATGTVKAIICPDDCADQRSVLAGFKALASEHVIELIVVKGAAEAHAAITRCKASIALVLGWYQLLPVADFEGTLFYGFHYSALPQYRGNAPLVWQIINGETRLGVSFFQLVDGMDEGDLLAQGNFSLAREETVDDALRKAGEVVQQMLQQFVDHWAAGTLAPYPQAQKTPSYCGLRVPQDGLIDWNASAGRIHDFIRAQTRPYPGAFTHLPDGRVLRVWASEEEPRQFYGVPGSVVEVARDFVVLACGQGAIRLLTVQVDEEAASSAPQVLRSLKLRLH